MKKTIIWSTLLFFSSSIFASTYFTHFSIDGQTYQLDKKYGSTAYIDLDESSAFNFNGQTYYNLKKAACLIVAKVEEGKEGFFKMNLKGLKAADASVVEGAFNFDRTYIESNRYKGEVSSNFDLIVSDKNSWVNEPMNFKTSYSVEIIPEISNNIESMTVRCFYK